jgi:iron complex transport system substrate-binding protein
VGGIVDPGARTPIGATEHGIETRGDVIMFTTPAIVTVALATAAGGTLVTTTEPPESTPADTFTVEHAENFDLVYEGDHKVLTVGTGDSAETFVLVQRGTESPALDGELADAVVVEVPVTSLFSASSSHYGFIDELDIEDVVTGVGDTALIVTPSLAERAATGEIESFSPNFVLDPEVVVATAPDVVVTGGDADPGYDVVRAAGIPVVPNIEWLETTPQGWAEWVGVFAALTNTEGRANELYGEWLRGYDAAAALVAGAAERPTVLTGGLFEGTWYSSGGGGIVAAFIADAGGDYVYADDPATGSIELDIETVLADGADAEYWLLPQGFTTREQAVATDERLGGFAAWDAGGVWTYEVPSDPDVSFLERGPVMIDEYLLDYVTVLHPELATDHELVFLSEVPAS